MATRVSTHLDEMATMHEQDALVLDGPAAAAAPAVTEGSDEDPLVGQTFGLYTIVEPLGEGGMGAVYKAAHRTTGGFFALKVLTHESETSKARFAREVEALLRIKHENIITVADFGTTDDGLQFMVMELAEGRTLFDIVQHHGPLNDARVATIVEQIAAALEAAHGAGFIHRDLKPENIMFAEGGSLKVLDFGLAGLQKYLPAQVKLTKEGSMLGTPEYMAPELIKMEPPGVSADLYSLGAIMYMLMAGKPPFTGDLMEVTFAHVNKPPPPLEREGPLAELAMELLEKNPDARPKLAKVKETLANLDAPKSRRTSTFWQRLFGK